MYTLQQLAAALNGKIENDHVRCAGPGHSHNDDSLCVWPADTADGFTFNSHAKDQPEKCAEYIRQRLAGQVSQALALRRPVAPRPARRPTANHFAAMLQGASAQQRSTKGKLVDSYHYTDATGKLLYEVLRFEPKRFSQRRPDGNGGQIWNLDGIERVIFRWPEIIAAPSPMTYVTEGEKDCNRLWEAGLVATTAAGSKWTDTCVQAMAGRFCVILEDNDEPGRTKALEAAHALYPVATGIRIVRLPDLPEGGDVSDWLKTHTRQEFLNFCNAVPDWHPDGGVPVRVETPAPTPSTALTTQTKQTLPAPATPKPATPVEPIQLNFFNDLIEAAPKAWLIKNVIARGECSSWIAPPGKGKSALLTDIFVHGAGGIDWRGYRVKAPFGGIYFALERVDLVKRRMTAHRLRDDLPSNLPIAIAPQVIDLMSRTSVGNIIDAIKRAEDRFGLGVGLVTFDTWARAIAAGGGDESGAKDQNTALANLRRVLDKVHVHIATIGHTGKDESRGERGSNAKIADVDLQVQLSGDTVRTATVKKANDQAEGPLTSFRLEAFDFGPDEDGDPFCTFIVSSEAVSEVAATNRSLSDRQKRALEALTEAVITHGVELPTTDGMPAGIKAVTTDQWRAALYRLGVLDPIAKNPRARVIELRNRLAVMRVIGVRDERVWPVNK
jgi:AAA domain